MAQAVERDLGAGRGRSEEERRLRVSSELLQELRVVLPGVQVLFVYLLTVPFAGRFAEVTALQRGVFFATLLCAAAAAPLLIAPSAHYRGRLLRGPVVLVSSMAPQ